MKKILVPGASGNIGAPLVEALRASGADFEVMRSKAVEGSAARVASFSDVASLQKAFAGIDTLFVLLPLVPNKLQFARNVGQAAKAARVKHIVRTSGAGADPQAAFALPQLQGTIDQVFGDTGIATTFLRPAGFMQNYSGYMAGMVKAGTVYGATADAPQSLIDVRDIAAVAATVLTNPQAHAGKAYTLTGSEALTDLSPAPLSVPLLSSRTQFSSVCLGMPSILAVTAPTCPPLTNRTASILNSSVYRARRFDSLISLSPKTDFYLSAMEYVFQGQGHGLCMSLRVKPNHE
jgi:uncharacterized protein YbjT (DUF2867 family)